MVGNIPSVTQYCFPFNFVVLQCPVAALLPHVEELEEELSTTQTQLSETQTQLSASQTTVETLTAEIQTMRRAAEPTESALSSVANIGAAIDQVSPSPHAPFPLFFDISFLLQTICRNILYDTMCPATVLRQCQ